jgi:hypothetical protein
MSNWVYWVAGLYFAVPTIAMFISGRSVTLRGWLAFILLWPLMILTMTPEELP